MIFVDYTEIRTNSPEGDVFTYGVTIYDDISGEKEIVDKYKSDVELKANINMETVEYYLEAEHYPAYKIAENLGEFVFNGLPIYL